MTDKNEEKKIEQHVKSVGVEIEAIYPLDMDKTDERYETYYSFVGDSSVHKQNNDDNHYNNYTGGEFRYWTYIDEINNGMKKFLKFTYDKMMDINDSCGFHIHLSLDAEASAIVHSEEFFNSFIYWYKNFAAISPRMEIYLGRLYNKYSKGIYQVEPYSLIYQDKDIVTTNSCIRDNFYDDIQKFTNIDNIKYISMKSFSSIIKTKLSDDELDINMIHQDSKYNYRVVGRRTALNIIPMQYILNEHHSNTLEIRLMPYQNTADEAMNTLHSVIDFINLYCNDDNGRIIMLNTDTTLFNKNDGVKSSFQYFDDIVSFIHRPYHYKYVIKGQHIRKKNKRIKINDIKKKVSICVD